MRFCYWPKRPPPPFASGAANQLLSATAAQFALFRNFPRAERRRQGVCPPPPPQALLQPPERFTGQAQVWGGGSRLPSGQSSSVSLPPRPRASCGAGPPPRPGVRAPCIAARRGLFPRGREAVWAAGGSIIPQRKASESEERSARAALGNLRRERGARAPLLRFGGGVSGGVQSSPKRLESLSGRREGSDLPARLKPRQSL